MKAVTLHKLGRRLVSEANRLTYATAKADFTPAELAILEDLYAHPNSSVKQIKDRTGFAQSHVSVSLSKLTERGQVVLASDPKDARSRLADLTPATRATISKRSASDVEAGLTAALGQADAQRLVKLLSRAAKILDVKK